MVKPINIGIDEQEQNDVTVPNNAATTFAHKPLSLFKTALVFSGGIYVSIYPKIEIKLKSNPKADAVKKAPDEVIAMAIRDAMLKDKENK